MRTLWVEVIGVKLCVPHTFVPAPLQETAAAHPATAKTRPTAAPKQLPITS